MKTIKELVAAVTQGAKPVVTFRKGVGDKESYAEEGMRARVIGVSGSGQDVITLNFSFVEFDAHNRQFESANYYDAEGRARLTAREAGFYKEVDGLYFDEMELVEDTMCVESEGALALYAEYAKNGGGESYVQWLEATILELRGRMGGAR